MNAVGTISCVLVPNRVYRTFVDTSKDDTVREVIDRPQHFPASQPVVPHSKDNEDQEI